METFEQTKANLEAKGVDTEAFLSRCHAIIQEHKPAAVKPWEAKAQRIIAALSREAYRAANFKADGTQRKRHIPYSIPEEAELLVDCLRRGDEETAKSMFVHNYRISKLPC